MAMPQCMTEGHGPATFVGTFFPSGDSVRLCDECMPNFCAAVFERMTGVDMAPAILMASEEGAEIREQMKSNPEEVAVPPAVLSEKELAALAQAGTNGNGEVATTAEGAPTDEPPAPAPADADTEATDPPPASATAASVGAGAPADVTAAAGADQSEGPPETSTEDPAAGV